MVVQVMFYSSQMYHQLPPPWSFTTHCAPLYHLPLRCSLSHRNHHPLYSFVQPVTVSFHPFQELRKIGSYSFQSYLSHWVIVMQFLRSPTKDRHGTSLRLAHCSSPIFSIIWIVKTKPSQCWGFFFYFIEVSSTAVIVVFYGLPANITLYRHCNSKISILIVVRIMFYSLQMSHQRYIMLLYGPLIATPL